MYSVNVSRNSILNSCIFFSNSITSMQEIFLFWERMKYLFFGLLRPFTKTIQTVELMKK